MEHRTEHPSYLLGQSYDPLLVKALLIHSAVYPKEVELEPKERLRQIGYGLPANSVEILHNDKHEFTMVFNMTFSKGHDVQATEFPFPESLVDEEGYYYGDVTVTLAVDPILNPNEATEYCQSEISVQLETYDEKRHFTIGAATTPKFYRNEDRMFGTQNVLAANKYSKRVRNDYSLSFTRERTLIEEGLKYQPIKKYHVLLNEMTPGNKKNTLSAERNWGIKLKALYRDCALQDMSINGEVLEQRAVLIVTIKDPRKEALVYDECMQQLRLYNYPHNNLLVQQHVQINSEN